MAAKRCPNCQLVNPASATCCDCGYSFVDGSVGRSLLPPKPVEKHPIFDDPRMLRIAIRFIIAMVVFAVVGFATCAGRH